MMLARVPLGNDLDPCTWNRDGSGMLVFDHHVVATLHSIQAESQILQGSDGLLAIHGGGIRHLANSDKLLQRLQP